MATLSSALNYALAGLSVSTAQSSVVARNVSSAGDENYTRKTAEIVSLPGSGPVVSQIARSTDRQLLDKLLTSGSEASARKVALDALGRMSDLTGDPQDDRSISAKLGKLQDKLRSYEQNPANQTLGRSALEAARDLTNKLNDASKELSAIRTEADKGLVDSAARVNNLLAQFKVVNDSIVRGQGTPADFSEALDQRDAVLKLISEEIGIRTTVRSNNDVQIYAEGGAVLFEGSPRQVSVAAAGSLQAGMAGSALSIDGVAVTGPGSPMPISSGRAAAYAAVRDTLAPQLLAQLDQMAAGVITAFSESDPQSPASLPMVEGLFIGDGALPDVLQPNPGLAARIKINDLADPDRGGSVYLIRDGGFGGASYVRNADASAGYQARIAELADAIDATRTFGPTSGLPQSASIKDYTLQSASWVEVQRQSAESAFAGATTTKSRAANALAQVAGVNIDQEMATLLDLEKSYQASSKVLSVVNAMLNTLLEAVGR